MHARALGSNSQPQTHHSQPLTAWPAALLSGTPQAVRACADGAELVTCGGSEFVLTYNALHTDTHAACRALRTLRLPASARLLLSIGEFKQGASQRGAHNSA